MNLRPSGYEPDELPDCSTPHQEGRAFYKRAAGPAIEPEPAGASRACARLGRIVHVLEEIGGPEAKMLLERISTLGGAAAEAAKTALKREDKGK